MTRLQRPIFRKPDPTVDQDVDCIKCSYNLRGLTHSGHCPECNTPVKDSLYSLPDHPLDRADPAHLRSLTRALLLLPLALAATSIAPFLALPGPSGNRRPYDVSPTLFVADLLARALICLAIFPLTRREPGLTAPEHPKIPAIILRTAAVAALLAPIAERLLTARFPGEVSLPLNMAALFTLLATPLCFWFLGNLARRLPHRRRRTLPAELTLLVLVAPTLFLVSICFHVEPGYASFPQLAFGYPADAFAHLRARPLSPPAIPVTVHLFTLAVLIRLWLAVRGVGRSTQ